MKEVLENRELFIKWAMVTFFAQGDKTSNHAPTAALQHAQTCADLFFPVARKPNQHQNPFNEPPAIQAPPAVNVAAPPSPGERAQAPQGIPADANVR
jgi:hypothetical protein